MTLPLLDTAAGPSTTSPGPGWPRLVAIALVVACAALSGPCECRRTGAWWAVDVTSASPTKTTPTKVSGRVMREVTAGAARGPSAAEEPSLQALGVVRLALRTPHPPPRLGPSEGGPAEWVPRGPSSLQSRFLNYCAPDAPDAPDQVKAGSHVGRFSGLGGLRRMRRILDRR